MGAPGRAEQGTEPVGRRDVLGPARGAAAARGVVVAASETREAATTTPPVSHPKGVGSGQTSPLRALEDGGVVVAAGAVMAGVSAATVPRASLRR